MSKIKVLVGVTGYARSGKDTAANYFVERQGFKKFNFSSLLSEELEKRGLPNTKEQMSMLGDALRKKYGPGALAIEALKRIKGNEKVVVCGVRSPEEWVYLKEHAEKSKLLVMSAPEKTRFDRRSKKDSSEFSEFVKRDQVDEEKKGLGMLIKMGDYRITNEGTLSELEFKLGSFCRDLGA